MSVPTPAPRTHPAPVPRPEHWHRPLLATAAAMVVLALVTGVLAVVDPREVLGQNVWFKPLKFSLSIAVYTISMAWVLGIARRRRRLLSVLGTVIVATMVVEMVIIVGAAALGVASHFNVSTPGAAALWSTMGAAIVLAWVMTAVVAVIVSLDPPEDRARTLALRAGLLLGLIGMGLAFFMTSPTSEQLADFQGVAGAHAVGVPDGGPGLPFLGWSTEGGDLRVAHFMGLHALQVIPLGLLVLEMLAPRVPHLRSARVRFRLVLLGSLAYAGLTALVLVQALLAQPVTAPSAGIAGAGAALALVTVLGAVLVLRGPADPGPVPGVTPPVSGDPGPPAEAPDGDREPADRHGQ